ncbi:hypothetical protein KK083_07865 [Fulvivirgaceae bacterium PWU4]|uniref:Uncharacterized protein n=1 Tax=Chryseosolibacter histidini TaxID=2782349 RepID=A0AAP2DI66_9BACT|nr:hypothetical protein [Chryseosolibacter histidini]MBT1696785.1 hypothetical protein [Chryseosolibacter histidini]
MKFLSFILFMFFFQDLPFKPKEEFEIKLDYKFKQRPSPERSVVNLSETRAEHDRRTSNDMLPYLVLQVKMLKLNDESRIRVTNNLDSKPFNKKIEEGIVVPLDLGFTADVKDRVTAHEYVITFLSPQKSEVSRILINVDKDGSFFVNGEKRGRF